MTTAMADNEGPFPTATATERPSAVSCATIKNRMENRRLVETLEILDKRRAKNLRRIQSMQEFLLNSRRQPDMTANGKCSTNVSMSTVETESGGELPSSARCTTLPSIHVQGRDCEDVDDDGLEITFTKSVVCLGNAPNDGHSEFPKLTEMQKTTNSKQVKVSQKSKQRMSSGTFLLIPEIQSHFRKGKSQTPLTPNFPFLSGRDRLRLASDPSPTGLTGPPPKRCDIMFGRSQSFSGLATAAGSSPLHSPTSTKSSKRYKHPHQRLQATRSFDRALSSVSSLSPTLKASFCSCCQSIVDCSLSHVNDEFHKLSLADQMEAVKGCRYLRMPPAGKTSPK
jgi:hypothetical protein